MADFLSSLAGGLRAAGGVLNPSVLQANEREQIMQQQQQQRTRDLITAQILRAAEGGAIDPAQASQVLQQQGINMPSGVVGPSAETQARQQALKNEQAFRTEIDLLQDKTPESIAKVAMKYGKPEIAVGLYNAQEQRAARMQTAQEQIDFRRQQLEQSANQEKARLEQRAALAAENADLKRYLAANPRVIIHNSGSNQPGAAPPGDYNKAGEDFLTTIPAADRNFVKKLANYEIDPKTLSTRGGERERFLRMATQYDPTFDQKEYNTRYNAINKFATGQQGNTVRSLNVAIDHMDTARALGDALKNGNVPLFNAAANEFAKQTGKPAPTNFEAVKEIVADEVVKGVIGGAGALEDRRAAAEKIRSASSPAQLNGVLDSWTKLLAGQVSGLEKQYEGSTGRKDFRDKYLNQRTRSAIDSASKVDVKGMSNEELLRKLNGGG